MSTPTPVETRVTALARRWRLEVDLGTDTTPDWQMVMGMAEFQPSAEPNLEDSSDYDSGGWAGNTKTGQSWEVSLTINRKINAAQKAYHPTHEALRRAAFEFDEASYVHVRYFDRNGLPEAYEGRALVEWAPSGGETTDLDQVEITLTGDGPLLLIDNPLADEED